jgi:hypothetical protein
MKQKYLILANSIVHKKELEIYEADYTNSTLSNKDIKEELTDTMTVLNKAQMNSFIITATDADKLFVHLLGYKEVDKKT